MRKLLLTFLLCTLIFSFGGCNAASSTTKKDIIFGLNETANVKASYGDYSLTITDVKESFNKNEFADSQPQRIIIVDYKYENINCTQDITVSYLYFKAYDSKGSLLEVYPSTEVKNPSNISAGGNHSASIAYGLNNDENSIKLKFYNVDYSNMSKPYCTFELSW